MTDTNLVSPATQKLPLEVTVATLSRLVINTSRRFVYPFAPALSRALGVPLPAITSLIALNQFTGLVGPLFGPLSDRWGYRAMMVTGLALLAAGMLAAGIFPVYAVLAVAVFLGGLTKSIFDPALQAYVGERVAIRRRGRVIGLIEMSWSGAALVGIPLVGLLADRLGWRAPFLVLGGLALLATVMLRLVISGDSRPQAGPGWASLARTWRDLFRSRVAVGALLFGFCVALANDCVFAVYGAWLEHDFGLGLVALGSATTVIGIAEFSGETLTATIADRLGLKRATLVGAVLSSLSYALLPLLGQTLPLALAALFVTFITFEFAVVTSFSLLIEARPQARATMMAAFLAAASLGRMSGALLGGPLWLWGGMLAAGLVAALVSAVGIGLFLWGIRGWQTGS